MVWLPLSLILLMLGGCGPGSPKLFWGIDEGSGETVPTPKNLSAPPSLDDNLYEPSPSGAATPENDGAMERADVEGASASGRRWTVLIPDPRPFDQVWPVLVDAAFDMQVLVLDAKAAAIGTDWLAIKNPQGAFGVTAGSTAQRRARYALFLEASPNGSVIRVVAFTQGRHAVGAPWINTKVSSIDIEPMLRLLARHDLKHPSPTVASGN